jgi:hypothetical protein
MPSFPDFMAPLEGGGGPAEGFDSAPAQRTLAGFTLAGQEEEFWCWSAVTQAIMRFVHGRNLSQQDIASEHARRTGKSYVCLPPRQNRKRRLSDTGGCGDGACTSICNDNHILRIVMAEQRCYRDILSSNAAPTFAQIRREIDAGRPLACRVQWRPAGGHFILVSGWTVGADGIERVHVLDPAANEGGRTIEERLTPYQTFATAYRHGDLTGYINYSYRVT